MKTRSTSRRRRAGRTRRSGVILLVILLMLALFTMVGIAFVLAALQGRQGAVSAGNAEKIGDPAQVYLSRAIRELIREPRNPQSVVKWHSLLADMYGPGVRGRIGATGAQVAPNELLFIDVPLVGLDGQPGVYNVDDDGNGTVDDVTELGIQFGDDFSRTPGYYVGRVITMLDGPAARTSSRVVGYQVYLAAAVPYGRLLVMPFQDVSGQPQAGNKLHLNGAAYNGAGFGLNKITGLVNGGNVYLPDPATYAVGLLPNQTDPGTRAFVLLNGVEPNEDYDAPDFQNMIMAGRVWNRVTSQWDVVLPSFHRPDLIQFWINRFGAGDWAGSTLTTPASDNWLALKRRIILRPLENDHFQDLNKNGVYDPGTDLDFTGKLNYNPTAGLFNSPMLGPLYLDVDNDGDGRTDSIWIDMGFAVQTAPSGRRIKPLVAVLCLDQDGKLNLNAHGSPAHYRYLSGGGEGYVSNNNFTSNFAGGTGNLVMPVGNGFSVADVNLGAILPLPYPATAAIPSYSGIANEYRWLLEGRWPAAGAAAIPGRYGEPHLLYSLATAFPTHPMPGLTSDTYWLVGADGNWGISGYDDDRNGIVDDQSEAGAPGSDDAMTALYGDDHLPLRPQFGVAGNQAGQFRGNLGAESSSAGYNRASPDLYGRGASGLDVRGQPVFPGMAEGQLQGVGGAAVVVPNGVDTPGELSLPRRSGRRAQVAGGVTDVDSPFTPAEWENLIRHDDLDSRVGANRLAAVIPSFWGDRSQLGELRHGVTTVESWDTPIASVVPTREFLTGPDNLVNTGDDFIFLPAGFRSRLQLPDLIRARLRHGGFTGNTKSGFVNPDFYFNEALRHLNSDFLRGTRLDLNRPFGDGVDNDGDGAIDDPQESAMDVLWQNSMVGPKGFDADNDGLANTPDLFAGVVGDGRSARQQFAQSLYILLMLFKDWDYLPPVNPAENPPLSVTDRQELVARRCAQWAINVVDFRDPDGIMSPFEYDAFPFNGDGWNVDGDFTSNVGDGGDRRVVWGCEYPDLLLKETMAFHDRRTEDLIGPNGLTTDPMGETDGLNDFDQRRMPQGSAFFELYCTRNPNVSSTLRELYAADGRLDLTRTAPASGPGGINMPVWRLAITGPDVRGGGTNDNNIGHRLFLHPETASLDPKRFSLLDPAAPVPPVSTPVIIERVIWPNRPATAVTTDPDTGSRVYYLFDNRDPNLRPGQYAIVGPHREAQNGFRHVTRVGRTGPGEKAPQQIDLGDVGRPVSITNNNGTNTYPATLSGSPGSALIQDVVGIPVGAVNVTWAVANPPPIGISVSEPLPNQYYPQPLGVTSYLGIDTVDQYASPYDLPLDMNPAYNPPILNLQNTQTTRAFKSVVLQRLADPTRPWHAVNNPYLTINWMPIDLTVFNGEYNANPANPEPGIVPGQIRFASRQWGGKRAPVAATNNYNLWKSPAWSTGVAGEPDVIDTDPPITNPTAGIIQTKFAHNLDHTFGFLNQPFQDRSNPGVASTWWYNQFNLPAGYSTEYVGDPLRPFPWLNWLNRPYANHLEILSVPATSQARLTQEFSMRELTGFYDGRDHYVDKNTGFGPPFGHLLNFFHSTSVTTDAFGNETGVNLSANHFRALEYLHVPSRFSGTDEMLNPNLFAGVTGLSPPFNYVSKFRDPGRVNLNSILDDTALIERSLTWRGVTNEYPGYQQLWNKLIHTRRGYVSTNVGNEPIWYPNANVPSVFANPFRSYGASFNVPDRSLAINFATTAVRSPVEASFLRPDPDDPSRPLFAPNFDAPIVNDFNNTDRSAAFRYQMLTKLGSTVTNRSHVFAIWLTVGYFEVERVPVDPVRYPDGWKIVQELGADTGEIKRNRAFYMYDRSIPVGFSPGENLNVEDGIILERMIE